MCVTHTNIVPSFASYARCHWHALFAYCAALVMSGTDRHLDEEASVRLEKEVIIAGKKLAEKRVNVKEVQTTVAEILSCLHTVMGWLRVGMEDYEEYLVTDEEELSQIVHDPGKSLP